MEDDDNVFRLNIDFQRFEKAKFSCYTSYEYQQMYKILHWRRFLSVPETLLLHNTLSVHPKIEYNFLT